MVLRFKGRSQCCHLVDNTPKRPNIWLFIVALFIDLLGRHIIRGPYVSLCEHGIVIKNACQSEITYFCVRVYIEEYVAGFQVSVKNLLGALLASSVFSWSSPIDLIQICSAVAILKSAYNLCENLPNEIFVYWVVLLDAATNYLLKVAALTILHYNVDLKVLFVNESIVILYNVGMLKFAQNIYFSNDLWLFLFIHFAVV